MASSEAQFNGSIGYGFRLRLIVDLLYQDIPNNRSRIRYTAYFTKVNSGVTAFNNFTTYGHTNINGYNPQRSIGSYNFNGPAGSSNVYLAQNEEYWVGHDANGNANPYFGVDYDAANAPFLTTAATGFNFSLPQIPRYANITHFSVTDINDVGFDINVSTDALADLLQYSIDGGGSWVQVPGDFTSKTVQVRGLPSGKEFPVIVWVRRKNSGLASQSGVIIATTLEQGKFLGFF